MTDSSDLSEAKVILLATHLCAAGEIQELQLLHAQRPTILRLELILRILLTFLPGSTEPSTYVQFLKSLKSGDIQDESSDRVNTAAVEDLTEADARKRVRSLRLLPLRYENAPQDNTTDALTEFIIHHAHRIEAETGLLPLLLELIEPFIGHSEVLRTWLISTLLPLLRFNYEYYPEDETALTLDAFEALEGRAGIQTLLSRVEREGNDAQVGRDLRGLVGPWTYGRTSTKRRKLVLAETEDVDNDLWQSVNDWIVSTGVKDFPLAVKAVADWDGPEDVDFGGFGGESTPLDEDEEKILRLRYGQAALATVYTTDSDTNEALENSKLLAARVGDLLGYEPPEDVMKLPDVPSGAIVRSTRASLFHNALLSPNNALTLPNKSSYYFLLAILDSIQRLRHLNRTVSCRTAVEICLFADEDAQKEELKKLVHSLVKVNDAKANWGRIRKDLLLQRSWQDIGDDEPSHGQGIFWRVNQTFLETELLTTLLNAGYYQWAIDLYTGKTGRRPLDIEQVEKIVEECIMTNYDNASNGNRTRGGMKRASDILTVFRPHLAEPSSLHRIEFLLAATHSLSFYHLTLQHGVPFQPVSIRVHQDPISLIEKVLQQNSRSYTKLDDLIFIGRNLVAAGVAKNEISSPEGSRSIEEQKLDAEHRVTFLAISAALSEDDFGTAYSYIMTRLSPSAPTEADPRNLDDDISWRAAFNAGRHRSPPASMIDISKQVSLLSQKMELLSLALMLAPTPDPLPEILGVWRRCDEEMSGLRSQEANEEKAWEDKGNDLVIGGFAPEDRDIDRAETERAKRAKQTSGRRGTFGQEDAPMGLFDMARGVGRAIGKNAFPLRGAAAAGPGTIPPGHERHFSDGSGSGHILERTSGEEQRVRKRDMVSNMVTGGLASGIGWVLGAQPVNK